MLIEPGTAAAYLPAERAAEEAARPMPASAETQWATGSTITRGSGSPSTHADDSASGDYWNGSPSAVPAVKKHFYGSIDLGPILAKKQFADLVDEVVQQVTVRPGVRVKIAIEIQAESAVGFDDGLQRAVRENCNVLRFKNAEFEAGTEGRADVATLPVRREALTAALRYLPTVPPLRPVSPVGERSRDVRGQAGPPSPRWPYQKFPSGSAP